MRTPAETFPPGEFIRDELDARGWTLVDAHAKLDNDPKRCCAFDLAAYVDSKDLKIDATTARDLAIVFGTSAEYWERLDLAWRSPVTNGESRG